MEGSTAARAARLSAWIVPYTPVALNKPMTDSAGDAAPVMDCATFALDRFIRYAAAYAAIVSATCR